MSKKYQSSSSMMWWIIGVIIISVLVILFLVFKDSIQPKQYKTNREVALACTTDMATQFHIHPNLEIIVNGEKQEILTDVGIVNSCMNALHTHDNTGKIHVESPEKRDFTLADFFAVWNKTYNKDQIFDYKVDDTHIVRQTVNGKETQDYENTVLYDNDQIIIYYEEKK